MINHATASQRTFVMPIRSLGPDYRPRANGTGQFGRFFRAPRSVDLPAGQIAAPAIKLPVQKHKTLHYLQTCLPES